MSRDARLTAFNARRDEVLAQDNLPAFIAWAKTEIGAEFSCDLTAEIAMHKARTAITTVPADLRSKSKKWLQSNGYEPWDDGDVAGLARPA